MPNNAATSADRAAEFQRLLIEQATLVRDSNHMTAEERETAFKQPENKTRAARLVELAELMPGWGSPQWANDPERESPERYVNERIAAWVKMNPLPLAMQHLQEIFEKPLYSVDNGVYVQIGVLNDGGYQYRVMRDDFAWTGAREEGTCSHYDGSDSTHPGEYCPDTVLRGEMVLRVPDSVAEVFREQGKRQLRREFATLMGLRSHLQ